MNNSIFSRESLLSSTGILIYLALFTLLLHFYTNAIGGYGYFRDELYYIACSEHLALGYVDQPPLSIYILAINRWLFGDSIFALRLLPAIAAAFTVFLTGLMVRRLGGGRFAQALGAIAVIAAPIQSGYSAIFSMNCFDVLLWAGVAYITIILVKNDNPKLFPILGLLVGLGAFNKISMLWLGCGLFVGLLLTQNRKYLRTKWPWIAGVIGFLIFLPYVIWNMNNDWAHLEFIRNASSRKYGSLTRLDFLVGQVMLESPFTLPLWLTGLAFYFISRDGKPFRFIGYLYAVPFLILLLNRTSKAEYLSSAYPMLFAGGALLAERLAQRRSWRWLKPVSVVALLGSGIAFIPFSLPILPVVSYIRYSNLLGVRPSTSEALELSELPQFYADMFGWEGKAAAVARVYNSLSEEEKSKCAIFADNYGRCGAIDFFGKQYGLPRSIGRHNNYWLWGPRDYTGELVIVLGGDLVDKQEVFEKAEIADTVSCKYCMPYENNLVIYICRNLKTPLKEFWPGLRLYI